MPKLPFGIADSSQLPASSGIRGGVVQTPVVQEPGIDADAATMPGRALAEFGQQHVQIGQYVDQAQAYQFQRQRAQDVLDAKMQLQEYRQQLLMTYDGLTQGDYRTLPEETLKEGKKLIDQHGKSLTPQARALFTEDAQQALTVIQQNALAERTKRRDQATAYTISREIQQVQTALTQTTDPYAREVLLGQFDDLSAQFVAAGLVRGEVMADARKKTLDAIDIQRNQNAIQADPDAMARQYDAQLDGLPTDSLLPLAPVEHLAELRQQARTVSRAQFMEREHQERYQEHLTKKQQDDNSIDLTTRLYTTKLLPENAPLFERMIAEAALMMKDGRLDRRTGEHIMNTAQAHGAVVSKPAAIADNYEVELTAQMAISLAESPQQFAAARDFLTQAAANKALKPETWGTLADKLERREKASYWRERQSVRAAKDVLIRGALIPYGGALAGQLKPAMQQKLQNAIDSFEVQIQGLMETQGVREVDRQAMDLAWNARIQFLKPDPDDPAQEYLPIEAQEAKTPHELAQVLHKLRHQGWADGTLAQILQNWHTWQDYARGRQNRLGTPQPGGVRPQPQSYQLPGGAATPSSEPRSR